MAARSQKVPEPSEQRHRLEHVPLGELAKYPRNPRAHDLPNLRESYDRFGFTRPLTIDERSGKVAAGNGNMDLLTSMKAAGERPPARIPIRKDDGEWMIPVVRGIFFKSDKEAAAYVLADNPTTSGWDDSALGAFLRENDITAGGIGFTASEIDDYVAQSVAGGMDMRDRRTLADFDTVAPPRRAWILVATSEDRATEIEAELRQRFEGSDVRIEVSIGSK